MSARKLSDPEVDAKRAAAWDKKHRGHRGWTLAKLVEEAEA